MNDRMYAHPRMRRNLAALEDELLYHRVGPAVGRLAAGEGSGPGRMAEPEAVTDAVGRALAGGGALAGKRVLVTAGGTREPVDAVRYLSNRSSGRMGAALARAAWLRGAEVTAVTGPGAVAAPWGVAEVGVETALEMHEAVLGRVEGADVVVHAAAVADFRPRSPQDGKLKRAGNGEALGLELVANPDIAADCAGRVGAGGVAVGFALETSDLVARAAKKMEAKGFDLIVGQPGGRRRCGIRDRDEPRDDLEPNRAAARASADEQVRRRVGDYGCR